MQPIRVESTWGRWGGLARCLALVSLLITPSIAQISARPVRYVTADPAGACTNSYVTFNTTSGNRGQCVNGTWAINSGSGSAPFLVVAKACTANALCTITHSLGTLDVVVSLIDHTTGVVSDVLWKAATTNTITFTTANDQTFDGVITTGGIGGVGPKGDTGATAPPKICIIIIGDPGASSPVLADDNDSPAVCGNYTGADITIVGAACWANAGSPTIRPILTGGVAGSILAGDLTCGTAARLGAAASGTPTVHTFSGAGAGTCAVAPCTIDANISVAGGVAKYIVIEIRYL